MGGNFDSNIKNRNGSKKYTVQNHTCITSHARVDQEQSQNTKIFHRENETNYEPTVHKE